MSCDRFEREALPRLERGLPLEAHFSTCPDCRKARTVYERLTADLSAPASEPRPPDGWERRVWARLDARRKPRRRRWLWIAAPAALAVMLTSIVLLPPDPAPASLAVRLEAGPVAQRGDVGQPGDRLLLAASTGGVRHTELRVYRNDRELVLRCADEPPCARDGDALEASMVLETRGSYQAILLVSDDPLPGATSAGLDADTAAALEAGATVQVGTEIDVR